MENLLDRLWKNFFNSRNKPYNFVKSPYSLNKVRLKSVRFFASWKLIGRPTAWLLQNRALFAQSDTRLKPLIRTLFMFDLSVSTKIFAADNVPPGELQAAMIYEPAGLEWLVLYR